MYVHTQLHTYIHPPFHPSILTVCRRRHSSPSSPKHLKPCGALKLQDPAQLLLQWEAALLGNFTNLSSPPQNDKLSCVQGYRLELAKD